MTPSLAVEETTLKQKIRYRSKKITESAVGRDFPDLNLITDEAVNCRNYYVHGNNAKLDYSTNFQIVEFFTDTLEFVFGASDLLEAGWDIDTWMKDSGTMPHPFGAYCVRYNWGLEELKRHLKVD